MSGRDAVIQNFSEIPSYWSSFSVEPQEYIGDTAKARDALGRLRCALSRFPPAHRP